MLQDHDAEPSLEETAEAVGLPVEETDHALRMRHQPVSLDQPVRDRDETTRGEWVPDYRERSPATRIDQGLLRTRIDELLDGLSWREREIIKLRYGLGDGHAYTLDEVGKIFAVTRERIRQIEGRAMRKLQQPDCRRPPDRLPRRPGAVGGLPAEPLRRQSPAKRKSPTRKGRWSKAFWILDCRFWIPIQNRKSEMIRLA